MHKTLKILTVFVLFTATSYGQIKNFETKMQDFEAQVDSLMNVFHTVGTSVAIIKNGQTIYCKGFGYRDLEKKIPADKNTIYGIGSCTKAFTASLFGILEGQGRLSLEDKPSKHIPELAFFSEEMDETIKLKHILSHSTGMPSTSTESSAVLFTSEDKNEVIPRLKYLPPQSGVNEDFIYNNYMYAVAGRITEHVTNRSWQENLSEYIFNPLDMNATYGNVVPASKDLDFALGYGVLDSIPTLVLQESFALRDAGGNIYSSVEDMSKWLGMLMNQGRYQGKQFLPKDYIKKAIGRQQLMSRDTITNESVYYGYGWMNSNQEGLLKVEHSGGISGYTSNIALFPEDDLAIVVLTNQNSSGIAYAITDTITSRLLGFKGDSSPSEPYFSRIYPIADPNTDIVINEASPPTNALGDFSGDYYCAGYGTISVSFIDNTLYAKFPFTTFRLEHQRGNVFNDHFTERKSQVMSNFLNFNFQSDEAGEIDRVLLNIDIEPVAFNKK